MEYNARTYFAMVINGHVGIYYAVASYHGMFFNGCIGINLRSVAHYNAIAYISQRTHVNVFAQFGGFAHIRAFAHPFAFGFALLVEIQKSRHRFARVFNLYQCGFNLTRRFEILRHKHYARIGFINIVLVLFGIKESECAVLCRINVRKRVNTCILVSHNASAKKCGYLSGCKFHFSFQFVRPHPAHARI